MTRLDWHGLSPFAIWAGDTTNQQRKWAWHEEKSTALAIRESGAIIPMRDIEAERFFDQRMQADKTVLTYKIFCDFLDYLRHRKTL
jgi:hypothetical protein